MKYVGFVIAAIFVLLAGAFLWNIVSTSFSGSGFNLVGDSQPTDSEENVINFEEDSSSSDGSQSTSVSGESDEATPTPAFRREGVISISSVRRSRGSQELNLRTNLNEGETVNITGWRIRTNENWVDIPEGVSEYDVSGSNEEEVIVLRRGDRVEIEFDESPISENLRLNKCTGFLNEKYNLGNEFPENCPRIDKSLYRHLSGDCQSYINSINGRCETPSAEDLNSFPGSSEGNECRRFLSEHFNVGYCYRNYSDDSDFYSNEWRVWIDESNVFDPDHDWIRLYNTEGTLISERDY